MVDRGVGVSSTICKGMTVPICIRKLEGVDLWRLRYFFGCSVFQGKFFLCATSGGGVAQLMGVQVLCNSQEGRVNIAEGRSEEIVRCGEQV